MATSPTYTNSCAVIRYPCTDGDQYINPCDCFTYLQCNHGFAVLVQPCAEGTAWDHEAKQCFSTNQVIITDARCDVDMPWRRCRAVTDPQLPSTLRKICSEYSNNGNDDDGGGGGGGSAAAVVGGVLGGLLIAIIIGIVIYVLVKKKSLPEWFRSVRETYKSGSREQQNEPAEEVYDVIDEKQVSAPKPIDNPGYETQSKPHGVVYNNTTAPSSHNTTRGEANNSENLSYSTLKPDAYNDINRSYSTLRAKEEQDLSRSISVNGADLPVQDNQGYFIGYPSGTVPRQPSPIPTDHGDDTDDGYSLGKAPEPDNEAQPISRPPSDYFVLQSSNRAEDEL